MVLHAFCEVDPAVMARRAREAERAGWDGLLLADSQNLTPDVFVSLTVAAAATEHIEVGTAVTNPVTRHPAVVASSIATLQQVSGGRAVLGLGRGDSALLQVGLRPEAPAEFERDAATIRRYLHGETVDASGYPSRLTWLAQSTLPPPPVQIFVSGPRLTRAAAGLADRVTVVVGARPERVAAHVEMVRAARRDTGLDPAGVDVGAYLIVGVDDDLARARDLVRGNVAIFAHFQRDATDLDRADRTVVGEVTARWEEATHGVAASAQAAALTDDFIDRFAVVGDHAAVVARLRALLDLGLDHLVLIGASRDVPAEALDAHNAAALAAARDAQAASPVPTSRPTTNPI
jgi:5,10-methylenetetrahydromethanopterin reductase